MTDREKHLENLKTVRATMDEAIKLAEKEVEKEKARNPELALGQVWKMNSTGDYYIVNVAYENAPILVDIHSGSPLKANGKHAFREFFTYIGMASDCVKVV